MSNNFDERGLDPKDRAAQNSSMGFTQTSDSPFSFVLPTEFVELPSKGKLYPPDHPLHDQETVEIRHMTAKDEDILTSETLLRKGLAIERLLENVIINKEVKLDDLLIGDKNAIVVATRITGYGPQYETKIRCPSCGENSEYEFDLRKGEITDFEKNIEELEIKRTEQNTFVVSLPAMKVDVEFRPLLGRDERELSAAIEKRKKYKLPETVMTDQFRAFICSVNAHKDFESINALIEHMPASDARHLMRAYKKVLPDIDLTQEFICSSCSHQGPLEVPFTSDFFWPNR